MLRHLRALLVEGMARLWWLAIAEQQLVQASRDDSRKHERRARGVILKYREDP